MRYYEFAKPLVLNEFGYHGHPGFGRGIFRKAYYEYIASELSKLPDRVVRDYLTDWFAEQFARDSVKFNEKSFRQRVADGNGPSSGVPMFQQRHFYYLADAVRSIPDKAAREFVSDWLAYVVGRTNNNFKASRWYEYCGVQREDDNT
jgi:hypothetical protein